MDGKIFLYSNGTPPRIAIPTAFTFDLQRFDLVTEKAADTTYVFSCVKEGITYYGIATDFTTDNLKDTTEITLLSDFSASKIVEITSDCTLDLNGKTFTSTADNAFDVSSRTFTINDSGTGGKITCDGKWGVIYFLSNGNYTMNGGTIEYTKSNNKYSAVYLYQQSSAHFTMNGGTIKAAGASGDTEHPSGVGVFHKGSFTMNGGSIETASFAVYNNGTAVNEADKTTININGGTLTSKEAAGIYHAGIGDLTITDGTISGGTGIEIRNGSLNVTGGTITGNAETYSVEPNGGGSTTDGAGIAIAQHTTKKDIALEVTGGNISGVVGLSISNPQKNGENDGSLDINIKGGTFTGTSGTPIASGNADSRAKVNISDGTFNGKLQTATITETGESYKLELDSFEDTYKEGAYNITGGSFSYDVKDYVAKGTNYQYLDGKTYVGETGISKMTATAYSQYIDDVLYYYSTQDAMAKDLIYNAETKKGHAVVAQIGENRYYTQFSDATNKDGALEKAATGDTIKLLDNVSGSATAISIDKEVTIDLNGKTISGSGASTISVTKDGNLTVKDTAGGGSVTNSNESGDVVKLESGGQFTLAGGTIQTTEEASGTNVPAGVNVGADSTFSMTGGNINVKGLGIANDGGNVSFSGGEIGGVTGESGTKTNPLIGIYNRLASSVLNILGGLITGRTGVRMRAGSLGVTGGKILGIASTANQGGANVAEFNDGALAPAFTSDNDTSAEDKSTEGMGIAIAPVTESGSSSGSSTINVAVSGSGTEVSGTTAAVGINQETSSSGEAATDSTVAVNASFSGGAKLSSVNEDGSAKEEGSSLLYASKNTNNRVNFNAAILDNEVKVDDSVSNVSVGAEQTSSSTKNINFQNVAIKQSAANKMSDSSVTELKNVMSDIQTSFNLNGDGYQSNGQVTDYSIAQIAHSDDATNVEGYNDLQSAFNDAGTTKTIDSKEVTLADTVSLLSSQTISAQLTVGESMTNLDFNGKTLTYSGNENAALKVGASKTLTLSSADALVGGGVEATSADKVKVSGTNGGEATNYGVVKIVATTTSGDPATTSTLNTFFHEFDSAMPKLDGNEILTYVTDDALTDGKLSYSGDSTKAFGLGGLSTSNASKISISGSNFSLTADNFGTNGITVSNSGSYTFKLSGSFTSENEKTFTGSSAADKIENSIKSLTVSGGEGADSITNYAESATVYGGADADKITNQGKLAYIFGDAGADNIQNNGESATVEGGEGNDFISNRGKQAYLFGGAGNDTITNNYGTVDNFVSLNGGAGHDQLTGSTNSKNFFIYTAGKDTIASFTYGTDMVSLSSEVTPFTDVSKVSYSNGNLVLTYSDSNVLTFTNAATASLAHGTDTYAYVYNIANSGVASITKNDQGVTLGAGYTAGMFTNSVGYTTVDASAVTSTLTINDYSDTDADTDADTDSDKGDNYYAFGTGSDTFNYASGSDSISNYTYGTDVISLTGGTAPTDIENLTSYDSTASKFVIGLGDSSGDSLTFDKNKVELKSGGDTYYYEPDRLIKNNREATLKSTFSSKTFNVQTLGDGFSGVASIDASKVTLSGGVNIIGNTVTSSANSILSAQTGGTVRGGDYGNTLISSGANASISVMLRGGADNDSLVGNTSKELFVYTGGTDSISGYSLAGGDVVRVDNSFRLAEAIYSVGSADPNNGKAKISLGWGGTDNLIFEGIGSLEGVLVQQGTANNYYTYAQQYSAHNKSVTLASGHASLYNGASSLYSDYHTINAAAVTAENGISIVGNENANYIFGPTAANASIDGGIGNDKINVSDRGTNANYLFEYTAGKDEVIGFTSSDSVAIDPTSITAAKASNSNTKLALTVDKNKNVLTLRSDDEIGKVSLTSEKAEYLTKDGYVDGQGLSLFGSARGQIDLNDTIYKDSNISLVAADSVKSQSVTLTGGTKGGTFIYAENNKRRDGFVYGGGAVSISGYEAGRDRIDLSAASLSSFTVGTDVVLNVSGGTISISGAADKEILLHDATKGRSYKKMVFKQTGVIENKQKNPTMVTVSGSPSGSKYIADNTIKKIYVTGLDAAGVSIQAGDKNNTQIDASLAGKGVSLSGGAKNDKLIGSDENDLFVYSAGKDIIQGYSDGDSISISNGLENSLSSAKITAGSKSIKFKFTNKDALTVKANKGETLDGSLKIGTTKYTYVKNAIENGGLVTLTSAFGGTFKTDDSKLDQNVTTVYGDAVSKNLTYKGTKTAESLVGGTKKTTFKGGGGGDSLVGGTGKDVFFYAKGEEGTTKIANFEFGANKDKLKIAGGTISQITSIEGGAIEFAMNNGKNTSNIGWFDITSGQDSAKIEAAKVAIKANNTYYWFAQREVTEVVTVDGGQQTVTLASAGQLITSDTRVSASDVSGLSVIDLNYSTNLAKAGVAVKVTGAKPTK